MTQRNTWRSDTQRCYPKGFTLIELLVVVLIIGILAAIAVPQYQLAVEKSRAAEAITLMSSLQKAVDLYLLQNGYPAENDSVDFVGAVESEGGISGKLDIDVESVLDCTQDDQDFCTSKNFVYNAACSEIHCQIYAGRRQNGNVDNDDEYYLEFIKMFFQDTWTKTCYFDTAYSYSEKLCKGLESQGWNAGEM